MITLCFRIKLLNAIILWMVAFSLFSCLGNNNNGDDIASLTAQQDQVIKDFLNSRNVQYQKTDKGAYLVISNSGTGLSVPKEDSLTVEVSYKLSVFEGNNVVSGSKILYNPKYGAFIKAKNNTTFDQFRVEGIHDANQQLREGGKAKVFLPGILGFGSYAPTLNDIRIPSYALLVVDVEVKDVRSELSQAEFEEDSINAYIAKKGYTNSLRFGTGLWKLNILNIGTTTGTKPAATSTVRASYKLYSLQGDLYDEGSEIYFELGKEKYIKGFEQAITTMYPSEKAVFALPSRIAYKSLGSGVVSPYEVLIYELTLDKIIKQ
jgi:FKBP-type peptidyl-prolyl cis-trans isomerase